jgi:hypothetical protein
MPEDITNTAVSAPGDPLEPSWKRLLSPGRIAAVLVAFFLIVQGYLWWRDRAIAQDLERDPAFATPAFELRFSRKMPYDPLTFLGRGAKAGLWRWTPEGLELTEEGRSFFEQQGDQFVSRAGAGRRRIRRISSIVRGDGGEPQLAVDFFYEWTELSPAAANLPFPAPRQGQEYLASARLARGPEGWQVQSLEARDFDEAMGRLREIASGVRK